MGSASKRIAIIVIDNILQFSSLLQFFDFSLNYLFICQMKLAPIINFKQW